MNLAKNINYYHINQALEWLARHGVLSDDEIGMVQSRLVEICQPDPEYIRYHC